MILGIFGYRGIGNDASYIICPTTDIGARRIFAIRTKSKRKKLNSTAWNTDDTNVIQGFKLERYVTTKNNVLLDWPSANSRALA